MDRILIAEAGKAIYEPLLMACRANGWESLTAHTAAEAVRLCRIVRFDLLLIDTVLPDEDGFSLAQRLQPFGIPVLFIAPPISVAGPAARVCARCSRHPGKAARYPGVARADQIHLAALSIYPKACFDW